MVNEIISYISLGISIIAIVISALSLWMNYTENKPKLEFSEAHISPWNKNQIIFYSILKNTGNKDITVQNINIHWYFKRNLLLKTWSAIDPIVVKKQSNYKLETIIIDNCLNQDFFKFNKVVIILDTTFGNIEKKFKLKSNGSYY